MAVRETVIGADVNGRGIRFHTIRFRALGTEALVYSPAAILLRDRLQERIEEYEARLSRFRPESEVSLLSSRSGRAVPVSAELFELLTMALSFWRETSGLFDPLILPALEAAGYDRSFEAVPAVSREAPGLPPRPLATFGDVVLDAEHRTVFLPEGAHLDLGGIAKGWIIDRVAGLLRPHGPSLIDIGGDMVAFGDGPDGEPGWLVAVANPVETVRDLCWLRLRDEAVATSTTVRRRWSRGGRWLHHLIDPRTGEPSQTDVLQATVVAPDAVTADVYAKTALLLGAREGYDWLTGRGMAAALFTHSGHLLRTPSWERHEVPMPEPRVKGGIDANTDGIDAGARTRSSRGLRAPDRGRGWLLQR
jgi:thiamine biosynthesis lipoprotein